MLLLSALQGQGFNNPYVQQMQQKLQQQQAQRVSPSELHEVQNAQAFRETLETRASAKVERPTFGEMIERGVDHVDAKQKYADNQVRMLMTGESDNLHHAMLSMEESGVAFNLMMETRNKLMEAYQQLMRMSI